MPSELITKPMNSHWTAHKTLLAGHKALLSCPPPGRPQACWVEFGDIVIYFNEPVKTSVVPDYYTVIKEPRDLGTIKKQLQRKQYDHPQQFYDVSSSENHPIEGLIESGHRISWLCKECVYLQGAHICTDTRTHAHRTHFVELCLLWNALLSVVATQDFRLMPVKSADRT